MASDRHITMIRNPVLEDIRSSVHSRPIPWKGLSRANVLTEDEVESFETLGRLSSPERVDLVKKDAIKYAQHVVQLFSKDIKDDIQKYLALFIVEYGSVVPQFSESLAALPDAFDVLVPLLDRADEQISTLAAVSIGILASTHHSLAPVASLNALFKYTIHNLLIGSKSDINYKDLGTQLLSTVLQEPKYRAEFLKYEPEAIPAVVGLVASAPLQVQYTALLVLWILTFDKPSALKFITEFNIIPVVLDAAKAALKEKIVRLSVALVANLVRVVPKQAVPVLIAEGALAAAKLLENRKWNDEELQADLQLVSESLTKAYDSMTTFEEYASELNAHRLRWTPVHSNKAFWIENIDEFKSHDWAVLKKLLQLATESDDSVTLAVACHDIAAVIDEAPEATQVITNAGGKVRLMELIANKDTEVRYEALKATQKMIAHIFV